MTDKPPPIRVSMRFGARSDVTLVQHLRSLPPRERVKYLRTLIKEGLRLRRTPPTP